MKRGDKVWVCQDGKFNRRVEGEVVKTRQVHHVCVQFTLEVEDGNQLTCSFWARMSPPTSEGYKTYSGWAEHEWVGGWRWYTVMKQSDSQCREDERITAKWKLERAFADFKKRGSNGKHKWNTRWQAPTRHGQPYELFHIF